MLATDAFIQRIWEDFKPISFAFLITEVEFGLMTCVEKHNLCLQGHDAALTRREVRGRQRHRGPSTVPRTRSVSRAVSPRPARMPKVRAAARSPATFSHA